MEAIDKKLGWLGYSFLGLFLLGLTGNFFKSIKEVVFTYYPLLGKKVLIYSIPDLIILFGLILLLFLFFVKSKYFLRLFVIVFVIYVLKLLGLIFYLGLLVGNHDILYYLFGQLIFYIIIIFLVYKNDRVRKTFNVIVPLKKILIGLIFSIILWIMFVYGLYMDITNTLKSPEEMIKTTQVNLIKTIKNTALAKQNVEFNSNIKVDISTPMGGGNANLTLNGKSIGYTGEINLGLDGKFSTQIPQKLSGSINAQLKLKTALSRIYLKLSKLDIKVSDPTLATYSAMANMIVGKRIYADNNTNTQDVINYKNLDLEKVFNENPIFKPIRVIKDNEFEVVLNKDSIANIVYEIAKQTNSSISGSKEDLRKELGSGDVVGVLKIRDNKYFEFSGNIVSDLGEKIPLAIKYKKDKIYISFIAPDKTEFRIDLNKNEDKFDGKVYFIAEGNQVVLNTKGLLNDKEFKLDLGYNQNSIKVNLMIDYNILKEINSVNIDFPKDAVSAEQLLGGFGLPQNLGE